MESAPPASSAIMSPGRPEADRSTTSSPSTTPIRVEGPRVKVTSFMWSPVYRGRGRVETVLARGRRNPPGSARWWRRCRCSRARGRSRRRGGCGAQEEEEEEVPANRGIDEAGLLPAPDGVDEDAERRAQVPVDEVGEPRTGRRALAVGTQ